MSLHPETKRPRFGRLAIHRLAAETRVQGLGW